jgi:hypothetical protein
LGPKLAPVGWLLKLLNAGTPLEAGPLKAGGKERF